MEFRKNGHTRGVGAKPFIKRAEKGRREGVDASNDQGRNDPKGTTKMKNRRGLQSSPQKFGQKEELKRIGLRTAERWKKKKKSKGQLGLAGWNSGESTAPSEEESPATDGPLRKQEKQQTT